MSVKVRVYIHGENAWLDKNVYVDIELPVSPRENDCVNLSHEEVYDLEGQAKKSREIAYRYWDWCDIRGFKHLSLRQKHLKTSVLRWFFLCPYVNEACFSEQDGHKKFRTPKADWFSVVFGTVLPPGIF